MTAGPWRPVYLEVSSAYVDDVRIDYTVTEDLSSAAGSVQVDHHGQVDDIRLSIKRHGQDVFTTSTKVGAGATLNFKLGLYMN